VVPYLHFHLHFRGVLICVVVVILMFCYCEKSVLETRKNYFPSSQHVLFKSSVEVGLPSCFVCEAKRSVANSCHGLSQRKCCHGLFVIICAGFLQQFQF
jgi:hypothetical protein